MIDQLKIDGQYVRFHELAVLKEETLESDEVDPENLDVSIPNLLAWYFQKQLDCGIPQSLEPHLKALDLVDSEDFYRLISKEYLYWRDRG